MNEYRTTLERELERLSPPRIPFDQLVGRRDRKRRDQRIRAGVLGLAIAIAMGWLGVNAIRSTDPPPVPADLPSTPESWSRVRLDPPLRGGEAPRFLLAGPGRLVAVGVHGQLDSGPATVWTSSDGATWTRTPADDLDRSVILDMRSGGPGFLATGYEERPIWTSEDGVSWSRLPGRIGSSGDISAVAPGGPGLVAVGSFPGAWFSSDGETWERASVPPVPPDVYLGDDGKHPQVFLSDVAEGADRLVAVGETLLDDNSYRVVVWTSGDGRSWTDVPIQAEVFPSGSSIYDLTSGPDGFVAIGRAGNLAAIWTSADGRRWRLVFPGPGVFVGSGVQLSSVAATDAGYVAVGASAVCSGQGCPSREAVVMTSTDGETWVRVPSAPVFRVDDPRDPEKTEGAGMSEVVPWGSGYAAVGKYDGEPTVWVSAATSS
jgi:hypothetical protein